MSKFLKMASTEIYLIPMYGDIPLYLAENHQPDPCLLPINFACPRFTEQSLLNFNLEPVKYYHELEAANGVDPSPTILANVLFFAQISPHAISQMLFLTKKFPLNFLHSFFSSPIIEYMDFLKATTILFSRIALPNSKRILTSIFKYSGQALQQNGFFKILSPQAVSVIVEVCIYFSSLRAAKSDLSLIEFTKTCYNLADLSALKPLTIELLYQDLLKHSIPLFFTFSDPRYPPNSQYEGVLSVKSSVIRKIKKRHFKISFDLLVFSPEDDHDKVIGGVEINSIVFISPAPKEKDPFSFMLCGKYEENIVFEINKGKRMPPDKPSLTLFASSQEELETWRSSLMFYSFRNTLSKLLER